ncbi:MAG: 50S ribosomal protein L11 methyltransferase [Thermoanaerobaculia bacterium]|nr:50S ribosomal protein L11 methyltransferase [Thermoanaerobaculia bacterium]
MRAGSSQARRYLRRTFRVAVAEEDRLVSLLAEQGSRGMEIRTRETPAGEAEVEVVAYFDEQPLSHPGLPAEPGGVRNGIAWTEEHWIEDSDWLAAYRERARPFEVGERFRIDPRDPAEAVGVLGDRLELKIPAGAAFGTGSHASTRLALEWLERSPPEGRRVLDVGCGSGILSLAAVALGGERVVGFDRDVGSALVAGQNARLNSGLLSASAPRGSAGEQTRDDGPAFLLFAGTVDALGPAAFDRILVNVLPRRIAGDLTWIARAAAPGGRIVLSGLVVADVAEVVESWRAEGWSPVAERREGDWVSLLLEATKTGSRS